MRDLYRRLGLGFGAEPAALDRAIARCGDAELARRAAAVLRHPARREAHDAVYRVARQLQDWRVELLLEDGAWAQALADSDLVQPDLPTTPLPAPKPVARAGGLSRWWLRWWPWGRRGAG